MGWPLSQDYNEAIQNLHLSFADADLRTAQAVTNALGLPMPRSGNFADVYELCCPATGRHWAVKCFTRPVPGLRERYAAISAHLQQARPRFAVDFQFLEQGIRVHGPWYPVLKMQWVEGLLLNEFVRDALDRPTRLAALAEVWVRLARRLREAGLAHGDLQHGNVLLVPDPNAASLHLRLVDYDGMFVPALAGQRSGEVGHPAYQHPQRLQEGTCNAEVDRFPLLVVYIAIRALMIGGRALWERYNNGDNLLFQEQDLRSPRESALVWELVRLNDPEVRRLIDHLSRAACKPLDQTPLLDDVLDNGPAPAAPASPKSASPPAVDTSVAAPAAPWYAKGGPATPSLVAVAARKGRGVPRREDAGRRRRLAVALVAGLVGGACVLLGGLAFWAASLPSRPGMEPSGLARGVVTTGPGGNQGMREPKSVHTPPSVSTTPPPDPKLDSPLERKPAPATQKEAVAVNSTPPMGTNDLVAISMALDKARSAYATEVEKAKTELLLHCDEVLKALDARGDRQAASTLRVQMRALQSEGIIHGRDDLREAILQYGGSFKKARDGLATAYAEVNTNYTKARELNKAKELLAALTELAPDARLVSFESVAHRGQYICHADYLGWLKRPSKDSGPINATFEIVPGLTNGSNVSFRSVNVPKHYLAHGDFRLRLQKHEDSDGYRQNATFKQVRGLAVADAASFEAVNYPGYYIHARGNQLFIDKSDGSAEFRKEATFVIGKPQFKLW
jgi:hypothetical protein